MFSLPHPLFFSLNVCLGLVLAFLPTASTAEPEGPRSIKGDVEWPQEWVVFAPFERDDEVVDTDIYQSVPERFETVSRVDDSTKSTEAERIEVPPGRPFDLGGFFEEHRIGNSAFVFLDVASSEAQTVTFGMGADWWMKMWVNGELVFDTISDIKRGNRFIPISMTNHAVEVDLEEGENIVAVHFIAGRNTATLALGGPREFEGEERRLARWEKARELNVLPETLEERLVFPVEEQAVIMAERGLHLPQTDADLSKGEIAGVQPMPERQIFLEEETVTANILDTMDPRFDEPVTIRLSKYRYPWEDRHLDAIVWTTPADEDDPVTGELEVILKDAGGRELSRNEVVELSPGGMFFSIGFPEELKGEAASLEVVWKEDGEELARSEAVFHVNEPTDVAKSGRVPLKILNAPGAVMENAPMTVGVPFPRGALGEELNVRLVDEAGEEQGLQTRVMATWSRFGPVKWLLCDFTIDLEGEPREWFLEYGPEVERGEVAELEVSLEESGLPGLDAGLLRVVEGALEMRVDEEGEYESVLAPGALSGAFVRHENGKVYRPAVDAEYRVEELGSEKAVILGTGWYEEAESGERFCQYVTRLVFHRDSPVVRIFHTWIFTGDGNSDRIADMGWRFPTVEGPKGGAILAGFDEGDWLETDALVQFDYREFLLPEKDEEVEGRAAGVMSMEIGSSRLTFGTKDFWQNFPSELEIGGDSFAFYNWPKNNPPTRFERPVARGDAFRHRFVHEGEVLDFRIPEEYAEGEIWEEATRSGSRAELHIAEGYPESVNAQGIARTEEMFLYLAGETETLENAAKVMRGLNDETLRAVVDPQWMTASGAFGNIHPYDPERFPTEEEVFELTTKSPAKWVGRLGFYGMWLHGDYPTWNMSLQSRTVSPYRALRKAHHQYPLKWIPFARSGDPEYLKLAENAARQMADANFCHYASEEVDASVGPDHFRRQGWWDRSLLPWAGRLGPRLRAYTSDSDYLWQTYYITGYGRARDVALLFGELSPYSFEICDGGRTSQGMLASYLDMYQATWDPWFLNSAHEIARMHRVRYGDEEVDRLTFLPRGPRNRREHWRAADQAFYQFTGSDEFEPVARNSAIAYASPRRGLGGADPGDGGGGGHHSVHAWEHTGDPMYLRRIAADLDVLHFMAYDGEVDYYRGIPQLGGHGTAPTNLARDIPVAMAVMADLEEIPEPLHGSFLVTGDWINRDDEENHHFQLPEVFVKNKDGEELTLSFNARGQGAEGHRERLFNYDISGPDGFEWEGAGDAPELLSLPDKEGVYRIQVSGSVPYPEGMDPNWFHRRVANWYFPLSSPEVPEVIRFEPEDNGTRVQAAAQGYWFMVPEDAGEFWIEFRGGHRASVWNPDGERVWDYSGLGDEPGPERAVIKVPEGQGGQLWRATGGDFTIDPAIPPYFSVTRSDWFNPEVE